jgi:hypothetical protein
MGRAEETVVLGAGEDAGAGVKRGTEKGADDAR